VRTIGLIGGIASGKSEVARLLTERGAVLIDADRVAHEAYAMSTEGYREVVKAFGEEVIGSDGAIDRRKLGATVFDEPALMPKLTSIVWPITRRLLEARRQEQTSLGTEVLVIEAAVLVEAGWRELVDEVWLVRSSFETAKGRLIEHRGLTAEDAESRIASRNLDALVAAADVVIDNDGDLAQLEAQVDAAWERFTAR
jgi:dephospho-CoA kinase